MDDIIAECREYVESGGRTAQPRAFDMAREVVRLADELAAANATLESLARSVMADHTYHDAVVQERST